MPKNIKLKLPRLHPAQQKVIDQAKRFNVLCCGRRFGKTTLAIHCLIKMALQGKPVAWFAPNLRLLGDVWRELQTLLKPVITKVNQQEYRLELKKGGSIEMWSLDSPDAGRGRAYALIVVDEAAIVPNLERAWQETIRPMLTDHEGEAWFLSTPRGMNYFKTLFDYGQDPSLADWKSWQMPTSENPRMKPAEIEAARLTSPNSAFIQEYLAQFVNGEGSVFRHVNEAATVVPGGMPEAGHVYVIGCDWGLRDYTVFLVLDLTDRKVVAMDRSNGMEYDIQCGRLKVLRDHWKPQQIIAELNNVGRPIIEQLRRDGLRVQAFTTTNSSKDQAIRALALTFERGDIHILNHPVLISELVAYQAEVLPSGQTRYGAPSGQHDDCVMALAIAWTAVSSEAHLVYPVRDEDIVSPDFPIPGDWPRAYACDLRGDKLAVLWGALDPQSGVLYICGEYLAAAEPAVHVAAIRSRGDWIPGLMDPIASGTRLEGQALIRYLWNLGLNIRAFDSAVDAGILTVLQRMQSGSLKVFASCVRYFEERRSYRRDHEGQIVKQNDHLQDILRCLVNGIPLMRRKPVPTAYFEPQRHYGDRDWMI